MKKKWSSVSLAMLFVLGLCVPSRGNDEQHPGGRLFYPLWDVSSPNRLTFIIVTREAPSRRWPVTAWAHSMCT